MDLALLDHVVRQTLRSGIKRWKPAQQDVGNDPNRPDIGLVGVFLRSKMEIGIEKDEKWCIKRWNCVELWRR